MLQESISEIEYSLRLGISPRTLFNYRKAGKTPPHFEVFRKGTRPEIRYLISAIKDFEAQKNPQ
jgi:hypothetical protein